MSAKKPTANLREAAEQATPREQLLKELMDSRVPKTEREHAAAREIERLRAALSDNQDWDEIEALRASLREHMAEIHRLRAAGRQALEALERADKISGYGNNRKIITALRAALEPVTDCHDLAQARAVAISNLLAHFGITSADSNVNVAYLHKQLDDFLVTAIGYNKGGGNLPPSSESRDLGEESLNEIVAQLKAATAGRDSRINFTPTHMVFTGDTLDCLKELADERNADTGETSDVPETNFGIMAQAVDPTEDDHIADANKMVASVRENRTVEPVAWAVITKSGKLYKAASTKESAERKAQQQIDKLGAEWECSVVPLYTAPPKREPLTDEQIRLIDSGTHFHESSDWSLRFARAIERAHGIGGEE